MHYIFKIIRTVELLGSPIKICGWVFFFTVVFYAYFYFSSDSSEDGAYHRKEKIVSVEGRIDNATEKDCSPNNIVKSEGNKLISSDGNKKSSGHDSGGDEHHNLNSYDGGAEFSNLEKIDYDFSVGSIDEKIEAIEILSKIGSQEQKEIIRQYALDKNMDISVRLSSLENIDWEENKEAISSLIVGDEDVNEAAIYMAIDKELSEEARNKITDAIQSIFDTASRPSTKIAILNYLLGQHSDVFYDFANRIDYGSFSVQQKEEIKQIIENKRKEDYFTNDN